MPEQTPDERPVITQDMINLFDDYTHLSLDRRRFMDNLARMAGSMTAATTIAGLMAANAQAQGLTEDTNPGIVAETITYSGADGDMQGYLVTPSRGDPFGAVIVVHENRGLNAHIMDVARRVALEGFIALAPDFLSDQGGTPADEDEARALFGNLSTPDVVADGVASIDYLKGLPNANGKVGAMGFCWGGGTVNSLAVAADDLDAAVAYYGSQPAAGDVPNIKARLMLHYAGLDDRINAGIPEFEAALEAAGTDYELFVYEGVNHAFNNDTSAARYDQEAADLAWSRTMELFRETLS